MLKQEALTTLQWIKCTNGVWCSLPNLNLADPHFTGLEGVYVIWHGGDTPRTVYVGQGEIANRLTEHRSDPRVLLYQGNGLLVTWAAISQQYRSGAERYLSDQLNPLVGERRPEVEPVPVNLPW